MRKFIITTLAVVCGSFTAGSAVAQQSLDQLLQEVKKARSEMSAENKQRIMAMSRSNKMLQYLNWRVKVTIQDSRYLIGTFIAFTTGCWTM